MPSHQVNNCILFLLTNLLCPSQPVNKWILTLHFISSWSQSHAIALWPISFTSLTCYSPHTKSITVSHCYSLTCYSLHTLSITEYLLFFLFHLNLHITHLLYLSDPIINYHPIFNITHLLWPCMNCLLIWISFSASINSVKDCAGLFGLQFIQETSLSLKFKTNI